MTGRGEGEEWIERQERGGERPQGRQATVYRAQPWSGGAGVTMRLPPCPPSDPTTATQGGWGCCLSAHLPRMLKEGGHPQGPGLLQDQLGIVEGTAAVGAGGRPDGIPPPPPMPHGEQHGETAGGVAPEHRGGHCGGGGRGVHGPMPKLITRYDWPASEGMAGYRQSVSHVEEPCAGDSYPTRRLTPGNSVVLVQRAACQHWVGHRPSALSVLSRGVFLQWKEIVGSAPFEYAN